MHPCVLLGDFEVHVQLQKNLVCPGTVARLRTELGGRKEFDLCTYLFDSPFVFYTVK